MLNNVVVMREEGVLDIVNLLITSVTLTNHSADYVGANRNMLTVSGKPSLLYSFRGELFGMILLSFPAQSLIQNSYTNPPAELRA